MMAMHAVLYLMFLMNLGHVIRADGPVAAAGDQGTLSCGQSRFSGSGVISSPNYPNGYDNNMNCTYIVTAPSDASIELAFDAFDLETGFDYLTIISRGLTIDRYTGSTNPPTLTLSSPVVLRFTSDVSVVNSGFSLRFTTLDANCGGLIAGSTVLTSPGYPNTYLDNLRCVWGLVARPGQTLTLDFGWFNLEPKYDWLEVYSGNFLLARFTASTVPPRMNLGFSGRIVFTTDSSVHYNGFGIRISSAALQCGGLVGGLSITSPNYPNNYPANSTCTWTFATNANSLDLYFTAFNLEYNYDFVKIYDGASLQGSFTGAVIPDPIRFFPPTRAITVVFTSDLSIQLSGFSLRFHPEYIR